MEQKKEEIKNLVNDILDSYDKYPITRNIDCRNRINSESVSEILEMIRRILFPGYFENKNLRKDSIEYHVGELLENIEYNLTKQVTMALPHLEACRQASQETLTGKAREITHAFLAQIPKLRDVLATDVQAGYEGDPAAFNTDEVIFSYPGMYAITVNRIAHELYLLGVPLIPRMMTEHAHSLTGIDIHPGASIGEYFFIDHGTGIVIGETTEIGDDVMIYQGVTLGGTGKDVGKRHPTIESGVMIGSGAKVLGPITIGRNAKVAAGAVVVKDVEPNCTVVGVPGEVVRIDGERVDDLDQINIPDPLMNLIKENQAEINSLKEEVKELKEKLK